MPVTDPALRSAYSGYEKTNSPILPRVVADFERNTRGNFKVEETAQLVVVPVGLANEERLECTFETLARQARRAPYPVHVFALGNYVLGQAADQDRIATNRDIVREARYAFPELPLTYAEYEISRSIPLSIGAIKQIAISGTVGYYVTQAIAKSNQVNDVVVTNWDADTIDATEDYFAKTQEALRCNPAEWWMSHPIIQHEGLDEQKFPYARALLKWYDKRLEAKSSAAPAHFSFNLGSILRGGNFAGSYGELSYFMSSLPSTLHREILFDTKAVVDNRTLVGAMALRRVFDYTPVTSEAYAWQSLQNDIPQAYFLGELPPLTEKILTGQVEEFYNQRVMSGEMPSHINVAECIDIMTATLQQEAAALLGGLCDIAPIIAEAKAALMLRASR